MGGQTPPTCLICARKFPPQTAYQIVMLEGVVKRGTGRSISQIDKLLAGKTGTTNDNRDAGLSALPLIWQSASMLVMTITGRWAMSNGWSGGGADFQDFVQCAANLAAPSFRIPPAASLVRINAKPATGAPGR